VCDSRALADLDPESGAYPNDVGDEGISTPRGRFTSRRTRSSVRRSHRMTTPQPTEPAFTRRQRRERDARAESDRVHRALATNYGEAGRSVRTAVAEGRVRTAAPLPADRRFVRRDVRRGDAGGGVATGDV